MPFKLSYPVLFLYTFIAIFAITILAVPVGKPAPAKAAIFSPSAPFASTPKLAALKPIIRKIAPTLIPITPTIKTFVINTVNVHVANYDITKMNVDVIVNAANKALPWPAGGVCKAIYLAADPVKLDPWVKANIPLKPNKNRIELGEAIASPSFDLAQMGIKHIIHTAGPDARIDEPVSAIYDAYTNSLLLADSLNAKSIAFPAISIGIFECDKQEVADHAILAILDALPQIQIKDIYLICLDQEYYDICVDLLS